MGQGDANESWLSKMLGELASKVLPLLVTGAGFLGFVAFIGGAITWARFFAAKLPAGQAVEAVPRSDLIVTGATALTLFALLGVLAVLVVYVISSEGLPSKRVLMGLLAIAFVESSVVVVLEAWGEWLELGLLLGLIATIGAVTLLVIAKAVTDSGTLTDEGSEVEAASIAWWAYFVCGGLGIGAGLLAWAILDEWWLAIALPLAGLLGYGAFLVTQVTDRRFEWFGVAVFASIALFGGIAGVLRSLAHPELQPAALIRKSDGGREGIQALFVADDDKRVWLASTATSDCDGDDLRSDSGRIFSVPADEVELLLIGSPQNVRDASRRSLEMLQDLVGVRTPAPPARPLTAWPSVRQDPKIDAVTPIRPASGTAIAITGAGFGEGEGGVKVGGIYAKVTSWSERKIVARPPMGAQGGHVTVLCRREVSPQVIEMDAPGDMRRP